jgi:putative membrane protein
MNLLSSLRTDFSIFWRGILMGAADVVPGVSGGTMAFIVGIYDRLLDAIRAVLPFLRDILRLKWSVAFAAFPWRFLLALGLGIATAILSLANFLTWALETHPTLVYAVFFGLIVASVFVVRNRIGKWTAPVWAIAAACAIGAYALVGLTPAQTPNDLWFIFLSGAIAICAMILPGISGAFILLLLGKYEYVLNALKSFDLPIILTFMLGAAIGIVSFASLLRWLLNHYHDLTVAALLGFMLGSLRKVFPWKDATGENILPASFDGDVLFALALMLVGFAAVIAIENLANRKKH